jgi:uncharacterized protein
MAIVLITGGTGMIGTAMSKLLLTKGYQVIVLTRNPDEAIAKAGNTEPSTQKDHIQYATWNPNTQTIDKNAIQQADYIVNLAGAGVGDKRWTDTRKKEIIDSRVNSAATLIKGLQDTPNNVKAVIQASGIDWYPDDPEIPNKNPFTETVPNGRHFLGSVCEQWEASIQPVKDLGKRLVILRTGMVVSKTGGAIDRFEMPVRFGVAAILSSGKQVISWIHIDDICRLYLYAIENEQLQGVYNAASPGPVSNKTLMLELATLITGRFFVPIHVPAFAMKLLYGELGMALLKSTTVSCEKISKTGFQFLYPAIEPALYDIEKK